MPLSELLLLSLDSFVASAVLAASALDSSSRVRVAALFGLGDALATIIGARLWATVTPILHEPLLAGLKLLAACASLAAIVLLVWVVGRTESRNNIFRVTYLLPILLSVDNLYTGHLLSGLQANAWLWAATAGSVSAGLSLLGWACGSIAVAIPRAQRRTYAFLALLLVAAAAFS